jgi:hypothetical protein
MEEWEENEDELDVNNPENYETELIIPTYFQLFELSDFPKSDLHKLLFTSFMSVKEACDGFEIRCRFCVASALRKPADEQNVCYFDFLQGTDTSFSMDIWHRQIDAIIERLLGRICHFFPGKNEEMFILMANLSIYYMKRAFAA